jgi:hypothetical protein
VFGLLVQATYSSRRVPIEMKKSTYSRCSQTVSTVKKSQASVEAACWPQKPTPAELRAAAPAAYGRVRALPHERRRHFDA